MRGLVMGRRQFSARRAGPGSGAAAAAALGWGTGALHETNRKRPNTVGAAGARGVQVKTTDGHMGWEGMPPIDPPPSNKNTRSPARRTFAFGCARLLRSRGSSHPWWGSSRQQHGGLAGYAPACASREAGKN